MRRGEIHLQHHLQIDVPVGRLALFHAYRIVPRHPFFPRFIAFGRFADTSDVWRKKSNAVETSRGESATFGLLELQGGGIMRHACAVIYVIAVKCEVPVADFNIRGRGSKSEERSRPYRS